MERITKIKTKDGQIFDTYDDAVKHINRIINDKLANVCLEMSRLNFINLQTFVMENLSKFEELGDLNRDLNLDKNDDDE